MTAHQLVVVAVYPVTAEESAGLWAGGDWTPSSPPLQVMKPGCNVCGSRWSGTATTVCPGAPESGWSPLGEWVAEQQRENRAARRRARRNDVSRTKPSGPRLGAISVRQPDGSKTYL